MEEYYKLNYNEYKIRYLATKNDNIGGEYKFKYLEYAEFLQQLIGVILNNTYCSFLVSLLDTTDPNFRTYIKTTINLVATTNCDKIEKNINSNTIKIKLDVLINHFIKLDEFFEKDILKKINNKFADLVIKLVKDFIGIISYILSARLIGFIYKRFISLITNSLIIKYAKQFKFDISMVYKKFKSFVEIIKNNREKILEMFKDIFNNTSMLGDPRIFINGKYQNAINNIIKKYSDMPVVTELLSSILELQAKEFNFEENNPNELQQSQMQPFSQRPQSQMQPFSQRPQSQRPQTFRTII